MRAMIADRPHPARRHLYVVLLAAGGSRRLGRSKALVRLNGTPLVRRQCLAALAIGARGVYVVTGARAGATAAALRGLGAQLVHNRAWRAGQATSLARGIRALPRAATHVLVFAVDQWQLDAAALAALAALAGKRPAAADHDGRAGIPAVFARAWFARLRALTDDAGARGLLAHAPVRRVRLRGSAPDLDTPADALAARRGSLGRALRLAYRGQPAIQR